MSLDSLVAASYDTLNYAKAYLPAPKQPGATAQTLGNFV